VHEGRAKGLTESTQGKEQRGFNVWDGQTVLGRVYLAENGSPAWDTALEPYIRAVLADDQCTGGTLHAELAQAAPHAGLRRLAHLAARKVGLISEWGIKKFNLDDLYIRFFRLAERRIAERTGKGVVCFISNFSYLGDASYVVMRERFLKGFDRLWFDCLNGDSRETGKLTPEGKPDPSVFSTDQNKEGIRVGTSIGLMVRKAKREKKPQIRFRHFWGATKRAELLDSLKSKRFATSYDTPKPDADNRYSFKPLAANREYLSWPRVTDLCAVPPSNGLMEKRGGALMDIDRAALEKRMRAYFNPKMDWEAYKTLGYGLTDPQGRFDPKEARKKALTAEVFDSARLVRYALRPFETRWAYYTGVRPVWNEPRPSLWAQCWEGNRFFLSRFSAAKRDEGCPFYFVSTLSDDHILSPDASAFPLQLKNGTRLDKKDEQTLLDLMGGKKPQEDAPAANLSQVARAYLKALKAPNPDQDAATAPLLWMHALAVGYAPAYLAENADGIRQDWPRIPLPADRKRLLASAALGQTLAALLDTEAPVAGVTAGTFRPELKPLGTIAKADGKAVNPSGGDLKLSVGWGHGSKDGVTMPGKGKTVLRDYTPDERRALKDGCKALKLTEAEALTCLGEQAVDVYLNAEVYWSGVPQRVWEFAIGGYQVIKKWLSYREADLLGRALTPDEARTVTEMVRRLAAVLLLQPALDANYQAVKTDAFPWK